MSTTTEYSINPFLPPDEYIPDGEPRVFGLTEGTVVGYMYFDFGDRAGAPATATIELNTESAGTVEVRLDDPVAGPVVAVIHAMPTGGRWSSFTAKLAAVAGTHAVYLTFHPDGTALGSLATIEFASTAQ